ncbi:hypothetical protein CVT26_008122 [Gymnopilus dilepis]|uniref:PARP catalytic domain-containing protein n=1 Tax=Gymnopilus dilepis TaxID=231916 RepID=A0A409YJW5_9AGAR|nr:hypothetical protein CVT26_008122 [Gymnopilus dilepis]
MQVKPQPADDDIVMVDVDDLASDDSFGSDFDVLTEADDLPEDPEPTKPPSYSLLDESPKPTPVEAPLPSKIVTERTSRPVQPEVPPPRYPRPGSMCIICKVKPVYQDSRGVFKTCGLTCAQKLEAASIPQSVILQGHMNNPRNSYDLRSGSSSHHNGAWQVSSGRTGHIRMCEVCHVRPKCQRGGKIYPTCGLTCAAKLHPSGSVEMCEYCKKRPKVILNGKKFPHCGRTCRDNAKMAAAANSSATCKTCLACWKAERAKESDDFCSLSCKSAVESRAPLLLDVPRGHASFKKVAEAFADSWKRQRNTGTIPTIKKIYMVAIPAATRNKQEQYKNRVSQPLMFSRRPVGQLGWLGTPRECGFGDAGNTKPCSSPKCLICSVVRFSVGREHFPEGIPTTSLLPRAVEIASNIRRKATKAVLLASVAFGNVVEKSDMRGTLPPQGFDSIHLVSYSNFGEKLDYGEIFVYDVAAIRPKYLILFE